ncbi:hypothetical protein ANRL1_04585 [Anaerolineae bacterium]|nr:hypothetical protein ANRL1_04585 [Anaerolineae bacterium]
MFELVIALICILAISWGLYQRQAILSQVESDSTTRPPRRHS